MAMVRALVCWSDQQSLGLKIMPKYLYDNIGAMMLVVTELLGFGLSKDRPPGIGSLYDLGKFISTVLESSKGEL